MPPNDQSAVSALETREVASLAIRSVTPLLLDTTKPAASILTYADKSIICLEKYQPAPWRKRARVVLCETKSFIEYLKKHKLEGRTLVTGEASPKGGSFSAVVDYHGDGKAGEPGWGEHNVTLNLVVTPEWKRWLDANRNPMSQEAFAEFLEDNLTDIAEPAAAELLEVAQMLTGKKGAQFKSGKNLQNGAIDFQYTETIEVGGGRRDDKMTVPDHFVIELCPFIGALGVKIKARLRFRISDTGKLAFFYILDHPDKIVDNAFQAARDMIAAETGLGVHMGSAAVLPAA